MESTNRRAIWCPVRVVHTRSLATGIAEVVDGTEDQGDGVKGTGSKGHEPTQANAIRRRVLDKQWNPQTDEQSGVQSELSILGPW